MNSHFYHCPVKAVVTRACAQQGQSVVHEGCCERPGARRRQDAAVLDEPAHGLALLGRGDFTLALSTRNAV